MITYKEAVQGIRDRKYEFQLVVQNVYLGAKSGIALVNDLSIASRSVWEIVDDIIKEKNVVCVYDRSHLATDRNWHNVYKIVIEVIFDPNNNAQP